MGFAFKGCVPTLSLNSGFLSGDFDYFEMYGFLSNILRNGTYKYLIDIVDV